MNHPTVFCMYVTHRGHGACLFCFLKIEYPYEYINMNVFVKSECRNQPITRLVIFRAVSYEWDDSEHVLTASQRVAFRDQTNYLIKVAKHWTCGNSTFFFFFFFDASREGCRSESTHGGSPLRVWVTSPAPRPPTRRRAGGWLLIV